MSQYLTNIGKVETAGAASITVGAVSATLISPLIQGTATIGTMNTIIIIGNGSASVSNPIPIMPPLIGYLKVAMDSSYIVNTAGWIVNVANTGASIVLKSGTAMVGSATVVVTNTGGYTFSVINSSGWNVNVSNTGGTLAAYQSGNWAVNIINTIGLIVTVNNTGGSTILSSGTALIGSANVAVYGAVSSTIINAHTATVVNAVSAKLIAGSFLVGSARVLLYGANSVNLTAGVASIGTASVILMNSSAVPKDVVVESMKMTSSGLDVYSYSTGIECSATNNLIISASANRVFKILGYTLMAGVANNAMFQSGSNSTELKTGTMFFGASGGMVAPYNPMGWFSVTAGSPLYLKLATANSVGGVISYLVM